MKKSRIFGMLLTLIIAVSCIFIATGCGVKFTVTFKGEGVQEFSQTLEKNEKAAEPEKPTLEGAIFMGWYNGDTKFDFNTVIADNYTLTAKWGYEVTFTGEGVTENKVTVEKGIKATKPADPVRDGFNFMGWYNGDTKFDFATTITANITLTAKWEAKVLMGEGIKAAPYLISHSGDFKQFAEKVAGAADDAYIYAKQTNDISFNEGELTQIGSITKPFMGEYDGANFKITNFKITSSPDVDKNAIGLFAAAEQAYIKNVNLSGFEINVDGVNFDDVFAVGALVGLGNLTTVSYCTVSDGTINVSEGELSTAYVGGLIGNATASHDESALLVNIEYCSVEVDVTATSSVGTVGGIVGNANVYNGAIGIVNSYYKGDVKGGQWAGGVVGYINKNVSVINCYASGNVRATGSSVSYAGGIVGSVTGNCLLLDNFAAANVTANASTGTYKSYAGAVAGYYAKDEFVDWYIPGAAVFNNFYLASVTVTCVDNITANGKKVEETNAAFFKDALKWTDIDWDFTSSLPTLKAADGKTETEFTITLKDSKNADKTVKIDKGTPINNLEAPKNKAPFVFYNWCFGSNSLEYRVYMPAYKNMELIANWQDASELVGFYKGKATKNGTLEIKNDGTFVWYQGSYNAVSSVTYNYWIKDDVFIFDSEAITATFGDGNLTFNMWSGMNEYLFEFTKVTDDIPYGKYIDPDGNIVMIQNGQIYIVKGINITYNDYSYANNVITIKGYDFDIKNTITVNADGTLSVDVHGSEYFKLQSTFTLKSKLEFDYTGAEILGDHYFYWLTSSSSGVNTNNYKMNFAADGTFYYYSGYNNYYGTYIYKADTKEIVIDYAGYPSVLKYDATRGIISGSLNVGTKKFIMAFSQQPSNIYNFANSTSSWQHVIKVNGQFYAFNSYKELTVTVEGGNFANNTFVQIMIDGKSMECLVSEDVLLKVEEEHGTYTGAQGTIVLDGMGNATVTKDSTTKTGFYYTRDGELSIVFEDDSILHFSYKDAQSAGNAYTLATPDKYQGVFYKPDASQEGKVRKLIIDGFGGAYYYYTNDDGEFALSWGKDGIYTYTVANDISISATFNQYNKATITIFYNGQVINVVGVPGSSGGINDGVWTVKGYSGSTTIPTITKEEGLWVGKLGTTDVKLEIAKDGKGTFNGTAITYAFDGETLFFVFGSTNYKAKLSDDKLVVTYKEGTTDVTADFTRKSFAGTYVGTYKNKTYELILKDDGTGTVNEQGDTVMGSFNYTIKDTAVTFTKFTYKPEWISDEKGSATLDANGNITKLKIVDMDNYLVFGGDFVKKVDSIWSAELNGTWTGKSDWPVINYTLVLNEDNSAFLTVNSTKYVLSNITFDGTVISFKFNGLDGTASIKGDNLELYYEDVESQYTVTLSKQAEALWPAELNGTWKGTSNNASKTVITLTINADNTLQLMLGTDAQAPTDIKYENAKLTFTFGVFTATVTAKDATIVFAYEDDFDNTFSATLSKQAA